MAYVIHLVERDKVPEGRDWFLVEEPGGDVCFVIARDTDTLPMPPWLCDVIADRVYTHYRLYGDRDYDELLVG